MKQGNMKWLVIVELIVFYFSILNVISHAKGPVPYEIHTEEPLIQQELFQPFSDMGVSPTENSLPLVNTAEGTAAGYQAELDLQTLEAMNIQFQIDCPPEQAGTTLFVDLYNAEAGYDSPEQEQQITLQAGVNTLTLDLNPGEQAPEQGWLRLFTLNVVNYQIENLQVFEKTALPKVTPAMIGAPAVLVIFLCATVCYQIFMAKRKAGGENHAE